MHGIVIQIIITAICFVCKETCSLSSILGCFFPPFSQIKISRLGTAIISLKCSIVQTQGSVGE